ncbi:N-acetylglucosamine-1-phosphodiester alpha-N-acetylglucosaminidase isoform X1 [Canis lupus familiaris]|uniref:N-acetylglucosamine-1-phosphodiester alpha-N-acetylglucosaminidase n=3 Tax=Canis lupus TaxID=9612 RepID=A0A8P0SN51_CANLF|nr:N-acetylglucosamine-1-phosphodiester alpha-N-acetylglucosaminidase isoform X1 [Canis lupus familiaris]XP_025272381.3 N-acetylglucosamine-1-phosphodiester alpha-N-acetylglucosaminidase isoform X1 [Canis lupus dingo]XP_038396396.1 N-acetylglucosamine-1-phosphodiester alpha-N-acetylglucosaminidase isoform X1 [Canis lupus familiaris]XP_038525181.1 N-acetylglucosamine-1-phosphodiester alpha-N-acetylglucosaminidase isoform X1 [Canis lupus familiaris]|eukprot:XP_005621636.1 N-acetylglucosamine-1-phosphodiester alpha-N-acetylglucosaminidase isoform X1 [Canis lupus familiaris]
MAASMGRWLFLLALLGFLQEAASSLGSGASRDDDLLLPYSRARARPARDCSRVRAGSREHESWPPAPAAPGARAQGPAVRTFVSHFGSRAVPGHLTRAAEPLRTFSVLEPGGSGGCASRRRATVEETARAAGCRVAQNGGFFRMETGECLGNVVSDGRRVSSSGGLQNAQFGIRRDGTLVTGYLSEEEVLDTENPFVQLLSGVVWLIRNGSVYINDSQAAECDETQETGSFSKFVNVMSARTAVGHDRKGQLVLFHADGQTEQRGINLWEMAEFLLKQDVVNAINLDGGGSATFVLNGTLASYPSDHCQDNMWRCPRRVSTVVCVHEPRCQPPDCSGHGTCVEGRCQCTGHFWQGAACNKLDCGPSNCSQHGLCTETGCRCEAGWTGSNCSEACSNSSFGEDCAMKCRCQNGAACDPVWGTCTCTSGFTGDTCEQECPLGWHGPGCQRPCECEHQCPCDPQTGNCSLAQAPALNSILSQVKQCLRPSQTTLRPGELSLLTGSSWLALTLGLVFLLLISTVANVSLLLGSRAERSRHLDGAYVYHPLQEMNGELLAAEKEQPADAHNPFKD